MQYVKSVFISLSCSSPVGPSSNAETHPAVFASSPVQSDTYTSCKCKHPVGLSETAALVEAVVESGWQTASHGVMLTFSPIALSLLTLHAPPCCSDLIGLALPVRPGGQDYCVSVHRAHLIPAGFL